MDYKLLLKIRCLLSVAVIVATCTSYAANKREYIRSIHNQYLATDFKSEGSVAKILMAVKSGLERAQSSKPEDTVAEQNLLELYKQIIIQAQVERCPKDLIKQAAGQKNLDSIFDKLKAYEAKNGKVVPVGWSLPDDFKVIVADVERSYEAYSGRAAFSFGLFGWLQNGRDLPEQIKVIRYPNTLILDKLNDVGRWSDGRDWEKPMQSFSFRAESEPNPPKEGLYLIKIKMKNSEMVNGWFVVTDMALKDTPIVSAPFVGQAFSSHNPKLKWVDYTSSQFRDFESRKRALVVYKVKDDSKTRIWQRQEVFPDSRESIVIDSTNDNFGYSDVKLTKGNYEFEATFQERWWFGDMLLQRGVSTKVPFSIVK